MDAVVPERAWLLMVAGDDRGHGGNTGYDDQVDAYYSWDSKVPNHKAVRVGDPVALWDKVRLLGVSVVEEITTSPGPKLLHRCPACSTTRIAARSRVTPRYRCSKCGHEFTTPRPDVVQVVHYRARYDAAWTSLEGLLDEGELRSLAIHAGDINSIRPLSWAGLRRALLTKDGGRAVDRVAARVEHSWGRAPGVQIEIPQGFSHALVRVRRGQQQFREQVLGAQGSVCAFTGAAPASVLEAGHLYSYARLGTHDEHGGLMLRRDVHRLFDDGSLAVEPSRLRVDVGPDLAAYPQYARLQDAPLTVPLRERQIDWLGKHWDEHRARSRPRSHPS